MTAQTARTIDAGRAKDLAKIHLAKKELGLDEDTYRGLLRNLTGKESAGELDARQRWAVLQALQKAGWKGGQSKAFPGRPAKQHASKEALIGKIEAQLAEAGRPWQYANAMAFRMFRVNTVQWCDEDQLRRLIAALAYDAQRHGRRVR